MRLPDFSQQIETVFVAEPEVENDQVELVFTEHLQRAPGIRGLGDFHAVG